MVLVFGYLNLKLTEIQIVQCFEACYKYIYTLNVKMTAFVLNQSKNQITNLATKLAVPLTPFFFVRQNVNNLLLQHNKMSIKINRQMSPFLGSLPQSVRLGFWNTSQYQNFQLKKPVLENSIVINPYKTQKLIRSALNRGITKMIVSDVEELAKIQYCYFKLRKQGNKINEPQYIWSVENSDCDLNNMIDVQKCSLPVNGLYFSAEMSKGEIQNFLQNKNFKNKDFENFRETTTENLHFEKEFLQEANLQPMITNYSETSNYLMICRILGKDKTGNPIFDDSCLDFICKLDVCSCSTPKAKVNYTFNAGGFEWAAVQPARLDRLRAEQIKE